MYCDLGIYSLIWGSLFVNRGILVDLAIFICDLGIYSLICGYVNVVQLFAI